MTRAAGDYRVPSQPSGRLVHGDPASSGSVQGNACILQVCGCEGWWGRSASTASDYMGDNGQQQEEGGEKQAGVASPVPWWGYGWEVGW